MKFLRRQDLLPDPLEQFSLWYQIAQEADIKYPEAMALATAGLDGVPAVRMVLLRGFDSRGFRFYTNYESKKGQQLAENPYAALLFYWGRLDRQVRIEVEVEKLSAEESDAYYANRPIDHQISAWASLQSQPIANREELEERFRQLQQKFPADIPRPTHWGGYLARPKSFEFWQQGPGRLHDRFLYSPSPEGNWRITRLAP